MMMVFAILWSTLRILICPFKILILNTGIKHDILDYFEAFEHRKNN